jgi:hypothetical protein
MANDDTRIIEEFQKRTDLPVLGDVWGDFTVIGIALLKPLLTPKVVCERRGENRFLFVIHLANWKKTKLPEISIPEIASDLPSDLPQKWTYWRHTKGGVYIVEHIGLTDATPMPLVIYYDTSGKYDFYWIRTIDDWNAQPEGQARFTMIQDPLQSRPYGHSSSPKAH